MRKIFKIIILILIASPVFSQDVLTLNQAVELALKNNYDIAILKNKAEIASINSDATVANFLPKAGLSLAQSASLNNLHQQLSNGSETKKNGVTGSNINPALNVTWTLFDGMKMFATQNKLKRVKEVGELNYQDTIQTMVASAITAYFDVVSAKQQLNALNDAIKISDERVKLAEKQFQVGYSSKVDWLQARVDLNEQKSLIINQTKLIEQKKAELNRILARAPETNFETTDSIPFNDELSKITATELDYRNLQMKVAAKNVEVQRFARKEIFSNYLPQLAIGGSYGYNQTKNSAGFTLLNQSQGFSEALSLNVPLFNGTLTRKQVKVADINVLNAETTYNKIHLLTKVKYFKAQKDYEKAVESLNLEEENILLVKENLAIATDRYRLRESTAIELRQAEQSYTDAFTRLVTARFAAKSAETELLRLMGILVKN